MTLFEQGLTEPEVLQQIYSLLRKIRERDPTFSIKTPLTIPTTDYVLSGESFEAFFKLSSGSIANMVIFLEAVHRGKLTKEALIELIENQIALPKKLQNQEKVISRDRRIYVEEARTLLSKLQSLLR